MMEGDNSVSAKHREVGIVEFVGAHGKITAVVKERFSDFHVHEIDPNGKQVHLTDLGLPVETKYTVSTTDPELLEILSEETRTKVDELQKKIEAGGRKTALPVEIDVTDFDKQQRTKIHRWISNYGCLGSSTIDKNKKKFIVVEFATHKMRYSRRPESRAKYTHCVLYKEGMETSDAVMFIGKKLRIQPNLISYCGTKDKRAKTTQRICVSNVDARRLIDVSKQSNSLKIGNFSYLPTSLSLGDLQGNHFKLVLKDAKIVKSEDGETLDTVVEKALKSLKEVGFINYYGLQRFGSFDVPTHAIGKALLQNKWDKAFDLILKPKPKEQEFLQEAKKMWFANRDAVEIVKILPSWYRSIESNLFYGLSRYYDQKDYISAFQRIPRNVRILYVHAFQSYLWNCIASHRVQQFGLKPVAGDLVYVNDGKGDPRQFEDPSLNIDDKNLDAPEVSASSEPTSSKGRVPPEVKVLKDEDLASYTIYDVLIPLPGTEVTHPNQILLDFYDNLLLENGLTQDCFLKYKPRQDAPRGAYRHLIKLPTEVAHRIIPYSASDNNDEFIPSDADLLLRPEKFAQPSTSEDKSGNPESESENASGSSVENVKDKKCVVVEFSLPSSSYATMALREILKDSSWYEKEVAAAEPATENGAVSSNGNTVAGDSLPIKRELEVEDAAAGENGTAKKARTDSTEAT